MKRLVLVSIRGYQLVLSPLLGPSCRFEPSCSRYAMSVIDGHGLLRGGWLALKRILRCHPFNGGGFDPPPLPPETLHLHAPGAALHGAHRES